MKCHRVGRWDLFWVGAVWLYLVALQLHSIVLSCVLNCSQIFNRSGYDEIISNCLHDFSPYLVHFCQIRIGKMNIGLILREVQIEWSSIKCKWSATQCKWSATEYNPTAPTQNRTLKSYVILRDHCLKCLH